METLNKKQLHTSPVNRPIAMYGLVGVLAFCIRGYLNGTQALIPGVNGGYYPLQVRSILTNGFLGFSDMPLLFYADAFLIKFISIFGFTITDSLILNVVKIVDSLSIPLLLIPLYKIIGLSFNQRSKILETSVIVFAVLSFSPLILTSDLQKNALAITFLFAFIAYLMAYQHHKRKYDFIVSLTFLLLTGLTHFGTFIFALFFIVIVIGYTYKRKAIIPLSTVIAIGLVMVAVFDITRFNRLLAVGSLIVEKPAFTNGMLAPPDYLIILFSWVLAIIGIIILKTKSSNWLSYQKGIVLACIFCLFTLSFPLLDGEYFKRLSLFLFIPQTFLILSIASLISDKQIKIVAVILFTLTSLSVLAVLGHPKETVLQKEAYEDLKNMHTVIKNDDTSIVIARHGLEWWTAWALKTKVGQDKAMKGNFFEKYKSVIFIHQIKGWSSDNEKTPFHEPLVPQQAVLIYSSKYFKVFKLIQ